MNRELKFRAWDTFTKNMVVTGFSIIGETTEFNLLDQYGREYPNPEYGEDYCMRMNDFVIMQYTGIKDELGQDIYEGDVVRLDLIEYPDSDKERVLSNYVCDVYWHADRAAFVMDDTSEDAPIMFLSTSMRIYVLGTIYEPNQINYSKKHLAD